MFESKLDGVFVLDAETMKVVLANRAAAEMYGFSSAEEAIGIKGIDIYQGSFYDIIIKMVFSLKLKERR